MAAYIVTTVYLLCLHYGLYKLYMRQKRHEAITLAITPLLIMLGQRAQRESLRQGQEGSWDS